MKLGITPVLNEACTNKVKIIAVPRLRVASQKVRTFLIASDIDGTWKSADKTQARDASVLDNLMKQLIEKCKKAGINIFYGQVTARPPVRVMQENIISPNFTLTYNGGVIHENGPHPINKILGSWEKIHKQTKFNADNIIELSKNIANAPKYQGLKIETVGQVVKNPAADGCKFISSICVHNDSITLDASKGETSEIFDKAKYKTPSQIKDFMADLETQLKAQGVKYKISPAYLFAGKPIVMFDIAAPNANKGDAINYLTKKVKTQNIIVAGDVGNDIAMMPDDGRNVIAVGNDLQLKDYVSKLTKSKVVIADDPNASCSVNLFDGIVKVLKSKTDQLYKKGQIEIKPDFDNFEFEPITNTAAAKVADYYGDILMPNNSPSFNKTVRNFK